MSITVVIQSRVDKLSLRHVNPDTKAEITVQSGTVSIYRGTTKVVDGATVVDVPGSLAGYERTWDTTTFPLGRYRAEWTLIDATPTTRVEDQFFEVVLREFRCPIGASDFQTKYPNLKALVEANGSTLDEYLETAWGEMELDLYGETGRYPGHIFYPEQFALAAEFWTVADAYRAISRKPGGEDDIKANHYRKRAMSAFESAKAFVRVDKDDDNVPQDDEIDNLSGGEFER